MIETFCILLFIILVSRIGEEVLTVPSTVVLLLCALLLTNLYPGFLPLSPRMFDQLLLLMLPIIMLPVVLSLSIEEMRRNRLAIFFLAVVAVLISVAVAVWVTPFLLPGREFTPPMLFALFVMLMATDAIAVTSIFTRFSLPEKLKVYAEGESLFNDVTSLVLYYFIALPMIGGNLAPLSLVNVIFVKVLVLSFAIGLAAAGAGYLAAKILKDPVEQFIIIYLVAVVSFLAAEHMKISGILAIIVSIVSLRILIDREARALGAALPAGIGERDEGFYRTLVGIVRTVPAVTRRGLRVYLKEAFYVALFANAFLFVGMASLVRAEQLLLYRREIAVVFLLSTAIRFLMVNSMRLFFAIPLRWCPVLTFAGVKGGLAIIMVHSLPAEFVYREMFEAVVMGVVLLSTFLYTFGAMAVLHRYRQRFREDRVRLQEGVGWGEELGRRIRDIVERDPDTGAYQRISLEEILSKEVSRAMRYKTELSLIGVEFSGLPAPDVPEGRGGRERFLREFGRAVRGKIRTSDYFCRWAESRYLVLAVQTPPRGAMALAEHIGRETGRLLGDLASVEYYLGVTGYAEGDTPEMLLEKLGCSIDRACRAGSGETALET